MNEQDLNKRLEKLDIKDFIAKIQIYFSYDDRQNKIYIDFDSLGEDFKKLEQELFYIQETQNKEVLN